ncbi:hypothetical protein AB0230_01975 [Microbacterium sp. NPDC089190]|uniref:hypothetical protein n=1 Tax=Microbacterium sp. NPDC089190 TaxID=3155063 RepID=UPI00344C730D
MSEFTASNGMIVSRDSDGDLRLLSQYRRNTLDQAPFLDGDDIDALREFFQAENDARLGRWRWPENPGYVVYPRLNHVAVVHEESGNALQATRDQADINTGLCRAARAYFDAHPEPKPWHDAKPGEVWELTVEGATRTYASIASEGQNDVYVRFFPTHEVHAVTVGTKAPVISAGRRIFPEVSS